MSTAKPQLTTNPYLPSILTSLSMKFLTKSPIVLALLATVAAAQNAVIGAPPAQSTFSPGQSFTVEVERPV